MKAITRAITTPPINASFRPPIANAEAFIAETKAITLAINAPKTNFPIIKAPNIVTICANQGTFSLIRIIIFRSPTNAILTGTIRGANEENTL